MLSAKRCLRCGKRLGIRHFIGADYCSDGHRIADIEEMEALMIERLHRSADTLRRYCLKANRADQSSQDESLQREEVQAISR